MIFTNENIIHPGTLDLFKRLQKDDELSQFFLVGGTALALQIGHRLSIDLDLFSLDAFDTLQLQEYLEQTYQFQTDFAGKNTLKGFIQDVKIDFITHAYSLVELLNNFESMRLASIEDISAMKLRVIGHDGNRQKDFYDIYFLLEHLSLDTMLSAYEKKYPNSNPIIALKGLTYFEDIDFKIEEPILIRSLSFGQVKKRLIEATQKPSQLF